MAETQKLPPILKFASEDGEYKRQAASFRNTVSKEKDAKFKPEADRYHLYVSYACPWAHRTLIVRALKGLDKLIGLTVVDPLMGSNGWKLDPELASEFDKEHKIEYLRDLYFLANKNYSGRFTVPVLWDLKLKTIVNNESSEIIRMFNYAFDDFSSKPGQSYYPDHLRTKIDAINEWIYDDINNGVYKTGFAGKQEVYEKHCRKVFESLDKVEKILEENEFLVDNTFTEADIRLFTTVARFDPVYTCHFKCNLKSIEHDYPNILRWARQVYQMPSVAATVNMKHIKAHYYLSHLNINPSQLIPLSNGPDLANPIIKADKNKHGGSQNDNQEIKKARNH